MYRFCIAALLGVAVLVHGGSAGAADDILLVDDRLAIVGASVPEFGGMYVDDDERTLVVNVTRRTPGIVGSLRRAIRVAFPGEDLPHRIRLQEAAFEFTRLKRWHDSAPDVLGIPGVIASDIDERANRLMIGVEDEGLRAAVAQQLDAAGVPPEAWEVHEMVAPIVATSVNDLHRPLVGGLEIGSGGTCTLGFVATRGGVLGFVTNSHCTNTQGGVESTRFAQPSNGFSFVGTETADPTYFTGGTCPAQCGFGIPLGTCRCRFSDSAFVRGDSFIAMTRGLAFPSVGQLAWNGTRIDVVSEGTPVLGLALRKVGRTTGHTTGAVTGTCVDIGQTGTRFLMKCQTTTSIPSAGGDSGSPVFRTTSCPAGVPGSVCARLYGVNWGGPVVVSSMGNIQRAGELGALDNCALAGSC